MEELLAQAERNLRVLELFSRYLNLTPCYVQTQDVNTLVYECGIDEETAVRLLVAAACELDGEKSAEDRLLEEIYFPLAVHGLDATLCRNDPYYRTIRLPSITRDKWRMGYKTIKAYELFTSDDLLVLPDGREIPQTGFFSEDFQAPMVEENGREWMTVTPSEINTMTVDIQAAYGKVAVFGLGLGYYAFMVSQKAEVSEIVVIERDEGVISLFREYILPQFPHAEKILILQADAFAYAQNMGAEAFDCAYVDIWHDVLDGVGMYLRMKRLETRSPHTRFFYWIEPSMLAWLRGMALMEVAESTVDGPMHTALGLTADATVLRDKLSDANLKKAAAVIPLEVAQR